jgi:uncharacterized membrane protein (DUF485 family)
MKRKLKDKIIEVTIFFIMFFVFIIIITYTTERMKQEIHKYSDIVDDNIRHKELIDLINNKCKL